MTPATLAIVLFGALLGLAYVLNHAYARIALIELSLNEGLPPGHQSIPHPVTASLAPELAPDEALGKGVHIFLSRSCHACQRLIDELDQRTISLNAPLHLRYVDRPRPIATSAASRQSAQLHDHQAELTAGVLADPLPYTIAIGNHSLLSRAVTPTVDQVLSAVRDAGILATLEATNQ